MVQANDGGANVSTDGGRTWSTQMNQPTVEIYGVWTDERFPYRLYGAQQDDGTHIISMAATGGDLGEDWWSGPGCETGPIMPHPAKPNIVYGSCKGQYSYMNMETGQSKNYWIGAQSLYGNEIPDLVSSVPAGLPHGGLAPRSGRPLLRVQQAPQDPGPGCHLGDHLARPHLEPAPQPESQRLAHHPGRHGRGSLQHALRHSGVRSSSPA